MDSKSCFILSGIFIIVSGFIYTIERLIRYIHWYLFVGEKMFQIAIPGRYIFVYLFNIFSIILFVIGMIKVKKLKN